MIQCKLKEFIISFFVGFIGQIMLFSSILKTFYENLYNFGMNNYFCMKFRFLCQNTSSTIPEDAIDKYKLLEELLRFRQGIIFNVRTLYMRSVYTFFVFAAKNMGLPNCFKYLRFLSTLRRAGLRLLKALSQSKMLKLIDFFLFSISFILSYIFEKIGYILYQPITFFESAEQFSSSVWRLMITTTKPHKKRFFKQIKGLPQFLGPKPGFTGLMR